jgi:O-phosphoseryl-tRNA(Cys) synthetase
MANIGDIGLFGIASGENRPCVVVSGAKDIEGIVYYDINVDVGPDDNDYLNDIEKKEYQPGQPIGDNNYQHAVRVIARRARKSTSPPEVGRFWIP